MRMCKCRGIYEMNAAFLPRQQLKIFKHECVERPPFISNEVNKSSQLYNVPAAVESTPVDQQVVNLDFK